MRKAGVAGLVSGSLGADRGMYVDNVDDGVPVAGELADLLGTYFQRERDMVVVLAGFGLDVRHVERAAGCGVEDAHQGALRVAVADVEGMHDGF